MRTRFRLNIRVKETNLTVPNTLRYSLKGLEIKCQNYNEKKETDMITIQSQFKSLQVNDENKPIIVLSKNTPFELKAKVGKESELNIKMNRPQLICIPRDINKLQEYWGQILKFIGGYLKVNTEIPFKVNISISDGIILFEDNQERCVIALEYSTNGSIITQNVIQYLDKKIITNELKSLFLEFNNVSMKSTQHEIFSKTKFTLSISKTLQKHQFQPNLLINFTSNNLHFFIGAYEFLILQHLFQQLNDNLKVFFKQNIKDSIQNKCTIYQPFVSQQKPIILPIKTPSLHSYKVSIPNITLTIATDIKCIKIIINNFSIDGKSGVLTNVFSLEVDCFNADKQKYESLIDITTIKCAWIGTSTRILFEKNLNVNITPYAILSISSLLNAFNSFNREINDISQIITPKQKEELPILQPFSLINYSGMDLEITISNITLFAKMNSSINLPKGSLLQIKMNGYKDISFTIGGIKQIIELTSLKTNKHGGYLIIERSSLKELKISSPISVLNQTNEKVKVYVSTPSKPNVISFSLQPQNIYYLQPIFSRTHFSIDVTPMNEPIPPPNPPYTGHIPTETSEFNKQWEIPITKLFGSAPVKILMITPKVGIPQLNKEKKYVRTVNFIIQHPYIFHSHLPSTLLLTLLDRNKTQLIIPPFGTLSYAHNNERMSGFIKILNDCIDGFTMEPTILLLNSEEFYLFPSNLRSRRIVFNSPTQVNYILMKFEENESRPTNVHFGVNQFVQNQTLLPLIYNNISLPTNGSLVPMTQFCEDNIKINNKSINGMLMLKSDQNNYKKLKGVLLPNEENGIILLGNPPIDIVYSKSIEEKSNKEIIILKQRYVIHNRSEHKIKFYCSQFPHGTNVMAKGYAPCNVSGEFKISLEIEINKELFESEQFEINKEVNCQMILSSKNERYIIISINITLNQMEYIICIDGIEEYYLCIQNYTNIPITFSQTETIHTYTIQPNQSLPFAWTVPTLKHTLQIYDKNNTIINPIISSQHHQLEFNNNEKKKIEIVYSSFSLEKSTTFINFTLTSVYENSLNTIPLYDFNIKFTNFGISILINDNEFLYISLFNMQLKLVQTFSHSGVEFSIDYIQIDNQDVTLINSKPVILSPSPSDWIQFNKQHYFHIGCKLLRTGVNELTSHSLHIVEMTVAIQTTEIQIDPAFLARAIEVYSIYHSIVKNIFKSSVTNQNVEKHKFYVKIEKFICNSIAFHLTINPSQKEPPPLSESATTLHHLTQMNAVKNVPIVIHKFSSKPIEMELIQFIKLIIEYFSKEIDFPSIKKQWASGIVGLNNIRLSYETVDYKTFERYVIPIKLFKDVEKKIPEEFKKALSDSFVKSVNQGVDVLTTGIASGVKGIWTTPSTMYQMAKEKSSLLGPIGFVGGLVAGVTGVVLKPIDGVVGLVQNLGMGISGETCGSIAEDRIRFPWYVAGGVYNEKSATGWSMMMESNEGMYQNLKYFDCVRKVTERKIEVIVITETHLLFITKNSGEIPSLQKIIPFESFKGIFTQSLSLILFYYENNKLSDLEIIGWTPVESNALRVIIENNPIKISIPKGALFLSSIPKS
ncbi:hypothetical protein EDI_252220 [Entamoeba dispar SAW760]|uniref:Vacuolar protein sorting-associated protein 13 DH-like domain-containing protein n=1 Tax=Entamoeba dispar (strain ATCC PRA-260 / SAW760) TaxID=370354 RepID=B0EFI3_ENTDS|nr:uncharacterized protein EDI_252220 [Entamoeba dispar SAW760]EDR26712.1 hypothetical protein EDI_252220 [Entamoeba dispar SAW760]|eukprot:EDR26712.1 hypothetical protein EDI_252220 [Entamoeba dispar SAW760]